MVGRHPGLTCLFQIWSYFTFEICTDSKAGNFFFLIKPFKNHLSCLIPSERDNRKPATVNLRTSKDRPNSTQIQRPNKLAWCFRFTVKLCVREKLLCDDILNGGTIINSFYNDWRTDFQGRQKHVLDQRDALCSHTGVFKHGSSLRKHLRNKEAAICRTSWLQKEGCLPCLLLSNTAVSIYLLQT